MDFFTDDQLLLITQRLFDLTARERLVWKAIPEGSLYQFGTKAEETIFTIKSRDDDDLAPHLLTVYKAGTNPPEKLQVRDSVDAAVELTDLLFELYVMVKRRVLDIDGVATSVLDELDRLSAEE